MRRKGRNGLRWMSLRNFEAKKEWGNGVVAGKKGLFKEQLLREEGCQDYKLNI